MRRTWENLRAGLVPAWVTWTLFGLAVAVYGLLVLAEAFDRRFAGLELSGFWVFVFPLGSLLLGRHGLDETAAKPVSFLLPGYRESWRRSSFSRAVRWGTAFSLYMFSESWGDLLFAWRIRPYSPSGVPADASALMTPGALEISLGMAGGLLGGMALCLFWNNGSLVHFRRKGLGALTSELAYVMLVVLLLSPVSEYRLVIWPILMPVSVLCCAYFWRFLGDRGSAKSGHRAIIVGVAEGPREIAVPLRSSRWTEELFVGRMRKAGVGTVRRSVQAWLYRTFGPVLPNWRWIAVPLLVGVVVQGYVSRWLTDLALWGIATLVAASSLPDTSSVLLPEGRRRRYYLAAVAGVFATFLLVTISAGAMALSWLLAALIPPFSWGTYHLQYAGIGIRSLLLVCLPVPWVFLSGSIGRRVSIVRAVALVFIALLSIGEVFARDAGLYRGPTLLPFLLIGGWALLPLTLWLTYRRCDLVGQRPAGED